MNQATKQVNFSSFLYRKKITIITKEDQMAMKRQKEEEDNKMKQNQQSGILKLVQIDPNLQKFIKIIPLNADLKIEEFNLSLAIQNKAQLKTIISSWNQKFNSIEEFKKLIPTYFNILKRGESWRELLEIYSQQLEKDEKTNPNNQEIQLKKNLNIKAFFQILFQNCNEELKLMILKLQSKLLPIPLIYNQLSKENDSYSILAFQLNEKVFYAWQDSFPVFCFSLGEAGKRQIGKTMLLNQIFYGQIDEPFEIKDSAVINKNSIDVMFDYQFGKTRKFCLIETHGYEIPTIITQEIGHFCYVWVIQILYEEKEIILMDAINGLLNYVKKNSLKKIIVIYRDCPKRFQKLEDTDLINFYYCQNNPEELSINEISKLIMNTIQNLLKIPLKLKTQSDVTNYFQVFQDNNHPIKNQIEQIDRIITKLQEGLTEEDGFINSKYFPIRNIDFQIKKQKEAMNKLYLDQSNNQDLTKQENEIKSKIKSLEESYKKQTVSSLMEEFIKILKNDLFYLTYIQFVDKLREFNESNCRRLFENNQQLIKELNDLKKKEKDKQLEIQRLAARDIYANKDKISQLEIQQKALEKQISALNEQQLKKAAELLSKQISIEFFWRELLTYRNLDLLKNDNQINPIERIHKMMSKGEPFEFLDGDNLKIDSQLLDLLKQFQDKKEKVLAITVLGPQSSGKSTILNKIFGCHFWTSVGRCTKGIYVQLLQIFDKSILFGLYDKILILDTEGLQNPNQADQEFDNKIALFTIAISDIVLINVRGDINQQFRNLVEVCVLTLSQLKQQFNGFKTFNWCFNQNQDTRNIIPFKQQLQEIQERLSNNQVDFKNQKMNVVDMLSVKDENIKVLGIAQTEKQWNVDENKGIWEQWTQSQQNAQFASEAYSYGLSMINFFIKQKLNIKDETNEIYTVDEFYKIAVENWKRIDQIKDLMEFSELIQKQQDRIMKKCIEDSIYPFYYQFQQAVQQNFDQLKGSEKKLSFEIINKIKDEMQSRIDAIFQQYENMIQSELKKIKDQHKIQKKIYDKYVSQSIERLNGFKNEKKLHIKTQIQVELCIDSKNDVFVSIDNEIIQLQKNPERLEKLKQEQKIDEFFEEKWNKEIEAQESKQKERVEELSKESERVIETQIQQINPNVKPLTKEQKQTFFQEVEQNMNQENQPAQDEFESNFIIFEKQQQIKQKEIAEAEKTQEAQDRMNMNYKKKVTELEQKNSLIDLTQLFIQKKLKKGIPKGQLIQFFQKDFPQHFVQNIAKDQNISNEEQRLNKINQYFDTFLYIGLKLDDKQRTKILELIPSNQRLIEYLSQNLASLFVICEKGYIDLNNGDDVIKIFKKLDFRIQTLKDSSEEQQQNQLQQNSAEFKNKNEFEQYLTDLVITESIDIEKVDVSDNNELRIIQEYLISPESQNHQKNRFLQCIKKYVQNTFKWEELYRRANDIVDKTLIQANEQNQVESIKDYNIAIVNRMMQDLQTLIEQANQQLSLLESKVSGDIQSDLINFSILKTQKILRQGQMEKFKQQLDDLKAQKENQKCKFKADISNDNIEQTKMRAVAFVSTFRRIIEERRLMTMKAKLNDFLNINSNEYQASRIMEILDDDIYFGTGTEYTFEKVYNYIRKPVETIKTEIQSRLDKLFYTEMKNEKAEYDRDLKKLVDQLKQNIKQLLSKINNNDPASEYFENSQHSEIYQSALFDIFMMSISCNDETITSIKAYQTQKNLSINKNYIWIFQLQNQQNQIDLKEELLRVNCQLNENDKKIFILQLYLQEIANQLNEINIEFPVEKLTKQFLEVQNCYDRCKNEAIGCEQTCPNCNRKCDEPNMVGKEHNHACKNGHQLRGMFGVVINDKPSPYSCDEIADDQQLQIYGEDKIYKWSEIKKKYHNWEFKEIDPDQLKKNKDKFKKIWNDRWGQQICIRLSRELNRLVKFDTRLDIVTPTTLPIHYILILDDSGSMYGTPWQQATDGAYQFMNQINNHPQHKISIIIFNDKARIVVEGPKEINATQMYQLLTYECGGTEFSKPLSLALQLINQAETANSKLANRHKILFYTDGGASYPTDAMSRYQSQQESLRLKIDFVACSQETNPHTLYAIRDKFNSMGIKAEVKNQVDPDKVGESFTEVLSKEMHQLG